MSPIEENEPKGITLHALLDQVSSAIRQRMPQLYWVQAEIFHSTNNNHWYLELSSESGGEKAKARGVIWASRSGIVENFEKVTGSPLKVGVKILFQCSVQFHAEYGFSLNIVDIDPRFTLGDMEARLEAIRVALRNNGEWDLNRLVDSPREFCRVAVIAPKEAAGLGDFRTQADVLSRFGLCNFDYYTAQFQGQDVTGSIIQAMVEAIGVHKSRPYDALVVLRGGGDKAGIYQLNELKIARCICRFPIPVLLGIGHERDVTILDEVANMSFSTPSLVGNHILASVIRNTRYAKENMSLLQVATQKLLRHAAQDIRSTQNNISLLASKRIFINQEKLLESALILNRNPVEMLDKAKKINSSNYRSIQLYASKLAAAQKLKIAQYRNGSKHHAHEAVQVSHKNIEATKYKVEKTAKNQIFLASRQTAKRHSSIISTGLNLLSRAEKNLVQLQTLFLSQTVQSLRNANDQIVSHKGKLLAAAPTILIRARHDVSVQVQDVKEKVIRMNNIAISDTNSGREVLLSAVQNNLSQAQHDISRFIERVLLQDPVNVIKRGFTLVKSVDEKPITKRSSLKPKQLVLIRFQDGTASAKIEE